MRDVGAAEPLIGGEPRSSGSRGRWLAVAVVVLAIAGVFIYLAGWGPLRREHGGSGGGGATSLSQRIYSMMNTSVDPCNDFYRYACGAWMTQTAPQLSMDNPSIISSFSSIEAVLNQQLGVAYGESLPAADAFLRGCETGDQPDWAVQLAALFAPLAAAQTQGDLLAALGSLHASGLAQAAPLSFAIEADPRVATVYRFWVQPGGNITYAGMPSSVRAGVTSALQQLFGLLAGAGLVHNASAATLNTLAVSDFLAANMPPNMGDMDMDDIIAALRNASAAAFGSATGLPLTRYVSALLPGGVSGVYWLDAPYWATLGSTLGAPGSALTVSVVADYLRFAALWGALDALPSPFWSVADSFELALRARGPLPWQQAPDDSLRRVKPPRFDGMFGGLFSGPTHEALEILPPDAARRARLRAMRPGWRGRAARRGGLGPVESAIRKFLEARVSPAMRAALRGDASAHMQECVGARAAVWQSWFLEQWIDQFFPPANKPLAQRLVNDTHTTMGARIANVSWLDNSTRAAATEKWSEIVANVAYDSAWENLGGLQTTGAPWSDWVAMMRYEAGKQLNLTDSPVVRDRFQPGMPISQVNSFYDPTTNTINMLAGIMYPPFLDASLPYMMTAAPYGMVVGHEMTHGFDNSGRLFDGVGAYRNWWSNASAAEFDARAQCLVDQYSGYSVAGMHVDGEQTLGENIADNGGIGIAFDTYRRVATSAEPLVSGLTNDQLFFVAFAQTWCEVALDIAYWQQILVDAHSPAPFRVLGPLSNLPAFAQAFQCSASSVYGRSLTPQRCQVW